MSRTCPHQRACASNRAGSHRRLRGTRPNSKAGLITPQTADLTGHDPIYLGAPIWLYSPAPPIWAFARSNRFDGKRVVLFNTLNSTFDRAYIEQFEALVMQRGAREFEHRFVRRGRMTRQLAPEAMVDVIDAEWSLEPPMHR